MRTFSQHFNECRRLYYEIKKDVHCNINAGHLLYQNKLISNKSLCYGGVTFMQVVSHITEGYDTLYSVFKYTNVLKKYENIKMFDAVIVSQDDDIQ